MAKDESAFARIQNKFLSLLDEVKECTMTTMEELFQECWSSKEKEKRKELNNEMDILKAEFLEAHGKA